MKKAFQLMAVLAVISVLTFNQTANAQINYGVKGGLNLAKVGGEDVEVDMRTGFHVGGFLEVGLPGLIAVEGGAYFSQKGFKEDVSIFTIENISTYIDIPVVAKFKPIPLIHFYAGPQVSLLLDNKIKIGDEEESGTDGLSPVDLGLVFGAGLNIPGGLRISAGYDLGLTSIFENENYEAFNRVIKISIGFAF